MMDMPEVTPAFLFKGERMVRKVLKGEGIFCRAVEATREDISIARDLLDTLKANSSICVGMAANMIGFNKRIIAISLGPLYLAMLNPKLVAAKNAYTAEEGCLSLEGKRRCERFEDIEVEFMDMTFRRHRQRFSGLSAEIIQHEMDHLEGKVI